MNSKHNFHSHVFVLRSMIIVLSIHYILSACGPGEIILEDWEKAKDEALMDATPGGIIQTAFLTLSLNDGKNYLCTGTLIAPSRILTAAHCTATTGSSPAVVSGTATVNGQTVEIEPNQVFNHSTYVPRIVGSDGYDVAIIFLKKPIDLQIGFKPYVYLTANRVANESSLWVNGRCLNNQVSYVQIYHRAVSIIGPKLGNDKYDFDLNLSCSTGCVNCTIDSGDSGGPAFLENPLDTPNDGMGGRYPPTLHGVIKESCFLTRIDPIRDWIFSKTCEEDLSCSSWDGDLEGCNAHGRRGNGYTQDCAYYLCSNKCRPRGTSNFLAGCTNLPCFAEEQLPCSTWDGNKEGCNAHRWKGDGYTQDCAYYLCSNKCRPRGTSNCQAGCFEYCNCQ